MQVLGKLWEEDLEALTDKMVRSYEENMALKDQKANSSEQQARSQDIKDDITASLVGKEQSSD